MDLALFCKTFRDDVDRVARLIDTVEANNTDRLPMILAAPRADHRLIADHIGAGRAMMIADEDIVRLRSPRLGWYQQQIVKLAFGTTGLAENFVIIDSDHYMLRPFRRTDFLTDNGTPYLILSDHHYIADPDNDYVTRLLVDLAAGGEVELCSPSPEIVEATRGPGAAAIRISREEIEPGAVLASLVPKAQSIMQRQGIEFKFMHGPIWSASAIMALKEQVLDRDGVDFETLIEICPWEANWYGNWVLSSGCIEVVPKEMMFIHFRTDESIIRAREMGITNAVLARAFLGVALAARHQELMSI